MTLPMEELVLKKARQIFPSDNLDEVMAILDEYGTRDFERERSRVQLAILKLSKGSMERLREYAAVAKRDYRDALAWAEYPAEMRRSMSDMIKMPESEKKRIYGSDRKQYLDWLEGENEE
jgi:hypothetical protein